MSAARCDLCGADGYNVVVHEYLQAYGIKDLCGDCERDLNKIINEYDAAITKVLRRHKQRICRIFFKKRLRRLEGGE